MFNFAVKFPGQTSARHTRRRTVTACRRLVVASTVLPAMISSTSRAVLRVMVPCFMLGAIPAAAGDMPVLRPQELASGVFVHVGVHANATPENFGAIANVGFVVGKRCVAVIDSGGSLAEGQALRSAITARTPLPVCYVINTHVHPDHVYGNAAFIADKPEFVGHRNLPASMQARRAYYEAYLDRTLGTVLAHESVQVLPGIAVGPPGAPAGMRQLDLGERLLSVQAWPTSHTDNDLTVCDEQTGTLWLGDLLFRERIPVIDGKLTGWLTTMEQLSGRQAKVVVPGHGAPGSDWPAMLGPQQRYLVAVRDGVKAAIKAHRTIGQAAMEVAPDERGQWLLFDEFHAHNVTVAFTELEWDD